MQALHHLHNQSVNFVSEMDCAHVFSYSSYQIWLKVQNLFKTTLFLHEALQEILL